MCAEIWEYINNYEGIYKISNKGNVCRITNNICCKKGINKLWQGRQLKVDYSRRNYASVTLFKNNIRSKMLVHRIVAETFIPNPENKPQINHIDGNKANNVVENLEWVSCSENIKHAYNTNLNIGSMKGKSGKNHNCSKVVYQFDENKNKINEFDSATEAAAFYNIHVNNITCCCRNPKKKSRGFYWRYKIDVLKE